MLVTEVVADRWGRGGDLYRSGARGTVSKISGQHVDRGRFPQLGPLQVHAQPGFRERGSGAGDQGWQGLLVGFGQGAGHVQCHVPAVQVDVDQNGKLGVHREMYSLCQLSVAISRSAPEDLGVTTVRWIHVVLLGVRNIN
ncbi:hypothetical protein [Kocuria sp. UCD-OTCP]|uniref:hypothetical protein n=1 Tax=Kocuria sp. UCD-OTCP TaxID=1292021 RepID=UPI0012378B84|nr:hypothetical protein [Kocuria sp. UCD-OTCP]